MSQMGEDIAITNLTPDRETNRNIPELKFTGPHQGSKTHTDTTIETSDLMTVSTPEGTMMMKGVDLGTLIRTNGDPEKTNLISDPMAAQHIQGGMMMTTRKGIDTEKTLQPTPEDMEIPLVDQSIRIRSNRLPEKMTPMSH
ncbi:uncharacterized protein [Littorina saxatilis]|uniref:uncharacterized protein n=1 Tax=Littorina saxatilis TaxID=31220 RepID=UPI0038B454DF